MRVGIADSYEEDWILSHPEERRAQIKENSDWLNKMGANITVPALGIGQKALLKWIESQAKNGYRIIVIDPISIADQDLSLQVWESDKLYIKAMEMIMRCTGSSIINVTHPRKDGASPSLDNVKGSMAWPNFTHNVFWLEPLKKDIVDCYEPRGGGSTPEEINRKIHYLKTREGKHDWSPQIGFYFDKTTLRFKEKGVIVK